jgi:hypothetical protein
MDDSSSSSGATSSTDPTMPGMLPRPELCIGGMLDGTCDVLGGESCDCDDCKDAGICKEDSCRDDAEGCDPVFDACTCPQCNNVHYCNNPTQSNCVTDGRCDPSYEGCSCDDCKTVEKCKEGLQSCIHMPPNGVCEDGDDSESCDCVDCFGVPRCVLKCTTDLKCESDESCACEDCRGTAYCTDPTRCQDDGICDIIVEGCVCADCKAIPECDFMIDAGAMPPSSSSASSGAGGGM